MNVEDIRIEEISDDFFFCFRSDREIPLLEDSVRFGGIVTPLLFLRLGRGYRLLSGFRRLAAARRAGWGAVPGIVCGEEEDGAELFRSVLLENRSRAAFTLVEKARILGILDGLDVRGERLRKDFLPVLGLAGRQQVLEGVRRVLDFGPSVQAYIETYDVSLKQSGMFSGLTAGDQEAVIGTLGALHIRSVELMTILEMLRDISGREDIPVKAVLREDAVRAILEGDLSRNEKLSRLKAALLARRSPRLCRWNEELMEHGKALRFPESVRIGWDRTLEKPGIELRATLRSLKDADVIARRLTDADNRKSFEAMFLLVS